MELAPVPVPVVVVSPHPLVPAKDRHFEYAEFYPRETLAAYLERHGLTRRFGLDGRRPVVCTIQGLRVPRALWSRIHPKPGHIIEFHAIVRGGNDGNKIGRTIGLFLVAVASFYTGGAAAAAYGKLGGALVAAGVSIVGGLAVNAIFPPPKPHTPDTGDDSPTYSLAGGSNQMRRYEPMPKIIGTHKIFPDLGAQPYNEFRGEDQFAFYVFNLGYNDVVLSDFKIGDTLLSNYSGVILEESGSNGKLNLFPGNVDTVAGEELTFEVGFIQRTSSPDATQLAVEITGLLFSVNEQGDVVTNNMIIEINYRLVGTSTWLTATLANDEVPQVTSSGWISGFLRMARDEFIRNASSNPGQIIISNSNRKPLRRTYSWGVDEGQYEVRVKRVSATAVSEKDVKEISWSQLRTYQPDAASYSGQKRIALQVRATGQVSGSLPPFSCIARAKTTIYDPSPVVAETSNPAWWYLDALRGQVVGGRKVYGANVPDTLIDVEGLKTFAAWCDSEGLTINAVLDTQMSVYDVLQTIALMGRGTPTWATGKLGVVWDAPNLPTTMVFGMQNILAGSFEIDYATEDLAEVIEAEFINIDLDWQRDVVRVQVPGTTGQTKVRRIQLFGRTNKELAAQDANLYAANNAYRNRRYKWTSDWEAMPCARGDVVQLSHDLASLDYSGRFVEGTTTSSLKLSKDVPLFAGGAFIVIVKPNGEMSTHTVSGGTGNTDTLTASPALSFDPGDDPGHPPYDYRWIYGPTATPGKKVKIEAFKPLDERYVQVSAIDEADYFYTAKDNPYTYVPPAPVFGHTPVIQGLTLTPEGVRSGKGYTVRVIAEWQVQGTYSTADVKVGIGDSLPVLVGRAIKGNVFEFLMSDRQNVTVEVTVYSDLGRVGSSAKAVLTEFIDFAGLRIPGDVSSFTIAGDIFNWSEVPEVDVTGYQIRFHLGDKRTWEDASPMHEGVITEHEWQIPTTPLDDVVVAYLIKAVDAAGQYSMNPAVIIKSLGDPFIANVLETVDYRDLVWPGTLTGGTLSGGSLVANTTALFYSGVDSDPLYTNDADPMYPATNYVQMTYETTVLVPAAPLQGSTITVQHVLQGDPHYLDWRQEGVGPFYGPDDSLPFYTGDTDLLYDIGEYIPWTGARVIEPGDRFQFRATAAQGPLQGIFSELLVTIDAPDLQEEFNNLSISASGTRLPITKDYTSIKSVQGTLENDGGTAVTFTIEDRDPDLGPLIFARNSSLTAVTGRGDFRVKGW